jgi:ATP-dependent DNA helicase 2 subunit 2
MFLIDISPSMGRLRTVKLAGEDQTIEMSNLEWSLQFVKLKIQEMVTIHEALITVPNTSTS